MPKNLRLSIPEPCHEDWYSMTPAEKGWHCSSCNKVVVDFTRMSDEQIVEYFKKSQQKTCGRFRNEQLNKEIPLSLGQRVFRPLKYIAASLLAAEILTNNAQAKDAVDSLQAPIVQTDRQTETGIVDEICADDSTIEPDTSYSSLVWELPVDSTPKPVEKTYYVVTTETSSGGCVAVTLGDVYYDPDQDKRAKDWVLKSYAKSFCSLFVSVIWAKANPVTVNTLKPDSHTEAPPKKRWHNALIATVVRRLRIVST